MLAVSYYSSFISQSTFPISIWMFWKFESAIEMTPTSIINPKQTSREDLKLDPSNWVGSRSWRPGGGGRGGGSTETPAVDPRGRRRIFLDGGCFASSLFHIPSIFPPPSSPPASPRSSSLSLSLSFCARERLVSDPIDATVKRPAALEREILAVSFFELSLSLSPSLYLSLSILFSFPLLPLSPLFFPYSHFHYLYSQICERLTVLDQHLFNILNFSTNGVPISIGLRHQNQFTNFPARWPKMESK